LTGGIGSGKSTALAELERLGCATLSTDEVVHSLYSEPAVISAVAERFGRAVAPDGIVDRAALAVAAFGTPEDRAWLEGLLWPLVGERMVRWRAQVEHRDPPPMAMVVEVPLLFEAGMEGAFDATICVVSDEAVRHERARARGHRALDERAARQLTQAEKAERATYVVHNDSSVDELGASLSCVLGMLQE
jgi:dephospho-CoA kinase